MPFPNSHKSENRLAKWLSRPWMEKCPCWQHLSHTGQHPEGFWRLQQSWVWSKAWVWARFSLQPGLKSVPSETPASYDHRAGATIQKAQQADGKVRGKKSLDAKAAKGFTCQKRRGDFCRTPDCTSSHHAPTVRGTQPEVAPHSHCTSGTFQNRHKPPNSLLTYCPCSTLIFKETF